MYSKTKFKFHMVEVIILTTTRCLLVAFSVNIYLTHSVNDPILSDILKTIYL